MELTFVGLSCVRLRGRDVEVVIDPIPPGVSSRPPRVNPDIVVRTEGSGDLALLRLAEGRPQEVSGPGEYELAIIGGTPAQAAALRAGQADAAMLTHPFEARLLADGYTLLGYTSDY